MEPAKKERGAAAPARARRRKTIDAETQEAIDWYLEMRYPGYGARQAKALAAQEEE